jgi:cytochrome c biogenesis protein CcmG/thiol:disulfide interchange protein DsbE
VIFGAGMIIGGGLRGSDGSSLPVGAVDEARAPSIGQPMADVVAPTVDGTTVRLHDLRGSRVWLTFGASWCQPCRSENADIEAVYEAARDEGVMIVAVFMAEDAATVRAYGRRVGLSFPLVADPDLDMATALHVYGIPEHFFIDRDGVLRQVRIGELDPATMRAALQALEDDASRAHDSQPRRQAFRPADDAVTRRAARSRLASDARRM